MTGAPPSSAGAAPADRLRVLEGVPEPRPTTNPYLVQLLAALRAEADVDTFTWGRALRGRYDVLHLHWPENLARGTSPLRTAARRCLLALLLVRLAVTRTVLVRTRHNVAPHEPGDVVERLLLRGVDRATRAWVLLRPDDDPTDLPARVVPHGHYRAWFADRGEPAEPEPGRLLLCGLLRRYKGVDDLLAAFGSLERPDLALRVVGRPAADGVADDVREAERADPRVSARLEFVPDDELATEVRRAAVVVLPYRRLHSSGAALLALSLDRPVVVPDGPAARELAAEVGPGWVATFDAPLTTDGLARALDALAAEPRDVGPDLSAREWDGAATAHLELFRAVVEHRHRGAR